MNSIVLVGRLATDPELKYIPSGAAVCEFRLAVDRTYKNQSGEREADFFNVKVWRERAETVANYMSKGRLVAVQGRMEIRQWVAQDGTKRSTPEVVAERVDFLPDGRGPGGGEGAYAGNRADNEPQPYGGGGQSQGQPAAQPAAAAAPAESQDFGDPFADQ